MISRRSLLKLSLAGGGAVFLPTHLLASSGFTTRQFLKQLEQIKDPATIDKFVEPLIIPPALQPAEFQTESGQAGQFYEIGIRQFEQQILPASMPKTTVWGYGRAGDPLPGGDQPTTFNSPAFTIEARRDTPVRVHWINQLVDDPASDSPNFLPHLLPVDQTLHWANPPGPADSGGGSDPTPYTGPVPIVTHLHGGHTPAASDGLPESWTLPVAANIPGSYVHRGSTFTTIEDQGPGSIVYEYPNDQMAATLWYHDHALGITRLNVYAGMAGFYLLRDDAEDALNLPGPAPAVGDAPDARYYEIPIVIQDRIFNEDGSLFYPDSRAFFDEYEGPFKPETPVSPMWNPEFFGNSMMVNGKTWPYLEVEPRLYRFRFLNGCNSRFMILKFDRELNFHQIGADGGLLSGAPAELDQLLMAPAERADVLVDFSQFEVGDEILLLNLGPDEPFGGFPLDPESLADPETTGQVMMFRVVELTDAGIGGEIPGSLPVVDRLTTDLPARTVTLHEELYDPADIPIGAMLGTNAHGPLGWDDETTEVMNVGDVEVWNIVNLTVDAHPIHLHLVQFQVVSRIPFRELTYQEDVEAYVREDGAGAPPDPLTYTDSEPKSPASWESGWKDTVIAYPGEVTQIIARFDLPGDYVWHCHIIEHEDNEMMRIFTVLP